MEIHEIVKRLIKKYGTRNPFKLTDLLGVLVVFEPLGSAYGYYSRTHRTKVIHINENLPYIQQYFTCAHELGHAVQHPNTSTIFLKKNTLFSTDRLEIEANTFAVELLLPDEFFSNLSYSDYNIHDVIKEKGIPEELLYLKYLDEKKFNL
ncbi:ImmA/IrrE family metallo-endopeptidase [Psychrobacillus antarcticus]|uniref:ImmA/IrrE family metallo-endopeptidase n=1 Tax=Psychrobacillus antarcticus TaxID=2879115 RepID=UPI0024079512|nr:ImmA/IrrE family metallo-endopeptidase [Psychrobacillus antarcticus]